MTEQSNTISKLRSSIAERVEEWLFKHLHDAALKKGAQSVHLDDFTVDDLGHYVDR